MESLLRDFSQDHSNGRSIPSLRRGYGHRKHAFGKKDAARYGFCPGRFEVTGVSLMSIVIAVEVPGLLQGICDPIDTYFRCSGRF
jgi:hypothetical protein